MIFFQCRMLIYSITLVKIANDFFPLIILKENLTKDFSFDSTKKYLTKNVCFDNIEKKK